MSSAKPLLDRCPPGVEIFSVSRLNRACRFLLAETFGALWIEGELSNFTAAASGHCYFTLKDAEAQVRCAMFRQQARLLAQLPRNGDHVLLKAQVSLYEPRGDYQLIVESLQAAGEGALAQAFERLKIKLGAEGLFDPAQKQPIPKLPRTIGVITSPTGAAIRDILTVLRRRFPAIEVIIYPVKVQGSEARDEIVHALRLANHLKQCEVLILGRGGGSTEDLWTFNEERVARAIHASRIPVISAVGHEIDFTISDFVADLRAPTPSAAAEAVSPDRQDWLERLARLQARFLQSQRHRLAQASQLTGQLEKRLSQQHPAQRLHTQSQRLDELETRLRRSLSQQLSRLEQRLLAERARLLGLRPEQKLRLLAARHEQAAHQLHLAVQRQLDQYAHRVARASQELNAVSPLATLARGYSITLNADTSELVRSVREVQTGDRLRTRLPDGELISVVAATKALHHPI
ncbi:MAG: exodeoxyribonuclease VII large subunit [Methylococcus sp.]